MAQTGKLSLKFKSQTPKTNYDYIQTDKNDNGKHECERCQIEFNDPSEVFWAECGDYSKKHGVPLCVDCCEDQQENWESDSEEEEDEEREKLKQESIARLKAAGPRTQAQADAAEARRNGDCQCDMEFCPFCETHRCCQEMCDCLTEEERRIYKTLDEVHKKKFLAARRNGDE